MVAYLLYVYAELVHFSFLFLLLLPYAAALAPTECLLNKYAM